MTTSIVTEITTEQNSNSLSGITLDPKQLEAVGACCDTTKRVVAVTGPAGCGKTTVLEMIYKALVEAGYRVALVSPTGKAAKRIYEVTGIEAMTIHRFLEYTNPGEPDPKTGKPAMFSYPRRNRQNPVEVDIVLADEYAMVPREVHRSLFDALPNGACIRVFGDNQQLPPIEEDDWKNKDKVKEPSPFEELLNKFPATVLQTVHRQGKDSGILMNLQTILQGRMPTRNEQWDMTFTDRPVDALTDYVLECLDQDISFADIDNQIITTQKNSWIGTTKLNTVIQGMFHNNLDPSIMVPRNAWDGVGDTKGIPIRMYVGDKVIVTRNMYDLAVMNGESGRIIEFSSDGEIVVDFGDKEQVIPPLLLVQNRFGKTVEIDPRKDLSLGYVITTHKSQGSEYRRVVYMLNKSTAFMQNRRNFYTAASRGRAHVKIITDQVSLRTSIAKRG